MQTHFKYASFKDALEDMEIFSGMNLHENVPMFLTTHENGYKITTVLKSDEKLFAIAVNRVIYKPE